MTLEELRIIEKSFDHKDWCRISDDIIVYEKDLSLVLKCECKERDYSMSESYNELFDFHKINDGDFFRALFVYNGNIVYTLSLFRIDNFFIPTPVAVNLPNEFYKNEIEIAKILSTDEEAAKKFFSDKEIIEWP